MPLLLLHGAIGSSEQMKPLQAELIKAGFDARVFDFCGHGGRELPDKPFSISLFADELVNWMNENGIDQIDVFGYSMGGYVGLYMAKYYPDRVRRVLTLATKFAWDVPTSQKEVKMLDPKKIGEKVPKFAETLKQRHAPTDWEEVLNKTAHMMLTMGILPPMSDEDFRSIAQIVQLVVGDGDNMVTLEETIHVCRLLQDGGFTTLPQTPHPIEQMSLPLLVRTADNFFNS